MELYASSIKNKSYCELLGHVMEHEFYRWMPFRRIWLYSEINIIIKCATWFAKSLKSVENKEWKIWLEEGIQKSKLIFRETVSYTFYPLGKKNVAFVVRIGMILLFFILKFLMGIILLNTNFRSIKLDVIKQPFQISIENCQQNRPLTCVRGHCSSLW